MLEQCDPGRSWHILNHHKRVERSSLVGRSGSIREVEEPGSVASNASVQIDQIATKDEDPERKGP